MGQTSEKRSPLKLHSFFFSAFLKVPPQTPLFQKYWSRKPSVWGCVELRMILHVTLRFKLFINHEPFSCRSTPPSIVPSFRRHDFKLMFYSSTKDMLIDTWPCPTRFLAGDISYQSSGEKILCLCLCVWSPVANPSCSMNSQRPQDCAWCDLHSDSDVFESHVVWIWHQIYH